MSQNSKMAVKKQLFCETELRLLQCEEGDTPSKSAVNALCLSFAVSKCNTQMFNRASWVKLSTVL